MYLTAAEKYEEGKDYKRLGYGSGEWCARVSGLSQRTLTEYAAYYSVIKATSSVPTEDNWIIFSMVRRAKIKAATKPALSKHDLIVMGIENQLTPKAFLAFVSKHAPELECKLPAYRRANTKLRTSAARAYIFTEASHIIENATELDTETLIKLRDAADQAIKLKELI